MLGGRRERGNVVVGVAGAKVTKQVHACIIVASHLCIHIQEFSHVSELIKMLQDNDSFSLAHKYIQPENDLLL